MQLNIFHVSLISAQLIVPIWEINSEISRHKSNKLRFDELQKATAATAEFGPPIKCESTNINVVFMINLANH